jgi:hypothetical protein
LKGNYFANIFVHYKPHFVNGDGRDFSSGVEEDESEDEL